MYIGNLAGLVVISDKRYFLIHGLEFFVTSVFDELEWAVKK